jgi:hypothetical protein
VGLGVEGSIRRKLAASMEGGNCGYVTCPNPIFSIGRFRSLPRLLNLPLTGPIELNQELMSKPCK